MKIYPRGTTSVWIKAPQFVASAARRVPWNKLSGTSGQIPARTRIVINSKAANAIVRTVLRK